MTTFALGQHSWHGQRVFATVLVLGYGTLLLSMDSPGSRVLGALVWLEAVVHALPWRIPRGDRSGRSFFVESLAYVAPGVVAVVLVAGDVLGSADSSWYYLLAVVVGLVLVLASGIDLRSLASGDLAFLYGPTRPSHAASRVLSVAAAPPGEEVIYRSPALAASGGDLVTGVAGAVGFVARHHLMAGGSRVSSARSLGVEVLAAGSLLALALLSGSLLPGLVAHYIANVPVLVLDAQRGFQAWQEEGVA